MVHPLPHPQLAFKARKQIRGLRIKEVFNQIGIFPISQSTKPCSHRTYIYRLPLLFFPLFFIVFSSYFFTSLTSCPGPQIPLLRLSCFNMAASFMAHNIVIGLNAQELGNKKSERVLVFGHGLGTDKSVWSRMVDLYRRDYRIIVYDLAFSRSLSSNSFDFDYYTDIDAYVADLFTILDYYGVTQCVYIGHSLSGMIGMVASIYRPTLFTKLILINASPCFQKHPDYDCGFQKDVVEEVFRNMESNFECWVGMHARVAVGGNCQEAIQEFSRTLFNIRPDIALFVAKQTFGYDLRRRLGEVQVPCYIIQSAKDSSVPGSTAKYLEDHLGGWTIVEILNTEGHLPQLSAPALLHQALNRALLWRISI